MDLHPLATSFATVAGAYERGRPGYPPEVVETLMRELGLEPGARVLDLAAGTGKLTRALVAGGLDVTAVEPLAEMAAELAAHLGADRVHAGVAEAIPLPDASVEAVTVADGFHWFDRPVALAEIRRVLEPGGGLALLSTYPDWSAASWCGELIEFIGEIRPAHPHFDGPSWQDAIREAGGWTEPRTVQVTTMHPARPDRMGDYLESMSFIAALPDEERAVAIARVTDMVERGTTPPEWPVNVVIGIASPA